YRRPRLEVSRGSSRQRTPLKQWPSQAERRRKGALVASCVDQKAVASVSARPTNWTKPRAAFADRRRISVARILLNALFEHEHHGTLIGYATRSHRRENARAGAGGSSSSLRSANSRRR